MNAKHSGAAVARRPSGIGGRLARRRPRGAGARRWIRDVLFLAAPGTLLALVWCGPASAREPAAAEGILFRIESSAAGAASYLFGTIHSEDPRVVTLPQPVLSAFDGSPRVALEVVPDASAIIRAMVTMAYTDGRRLRDQLPPELYRETAAALGGLGMPEEAFKDLKPWAVATLLGAPPSTTGEFLDMRLYRMASAAGKPIEGLETMAEQLAVFDTLDESDQIALLRETLASRDRLPAIFEALISAYAERRLGALRDLSDDYLAAGDPALAELFRDVVIESRNLRMVDRIVPLIDQGGWFIAVGALHLPGEAGILELLRRQGHAIEVVY